MVILGMVHDRLNLTLARYSQHWPSALFQACERSSEWSQVLMLCGFTNSRCSWQNMANLKLVDLLAYFSCWVSKCVYLVLAFARVTYQKRFADTVTDSRPLICCWFFGGNPCIIFDVPLKAFTWGCLLQKLHHSERHRSDLTYCGAICFSEQSSSTTVIICRALSTSR